MRAFFGYLLVFSLVALIHWTMNLSELESLDGHAYTLMNSDLRVVAGLLSDYKNRWGRYPTNDEGLAVLITPELVHRKEVSQTKKKCGFVPEGDLFGLTNHLQASVFGYIDVHEYPLGYENRQEVDEKKFSASPLPLEPSSERWLSSGFSSYEEGGWWMEVDRDVYIYSLSAKPQWENYVETRDDYRFSVGLLTLLASGAFIGFIVLTQRADKRMGPDGKFVEKDSFNWVLGSFLFIIGFFGATARPTCYMMSYWPRYRVPKEVDLYNEIIQDFHEKGVINSETLAKLKAASSVEQAEFRESVFWGR